jgi:hypothetical protein
MSCAEVKTVIHPVAPRWTAGFSARISRSGGTAGRKIMVVLNAKPEWLAHARSPKVAVANPLGP